MFGLMRGCSCALDLAERQAWRGYFCGLCLAIKDNQGQMARIATNHDAALLGVLCDAQDPENTTWRTSFCPLRRPIKTTIVDPQTPGARFAASMAILMAATRLEDHVADDELFWGRHPRFSKWLAQKWQYTAHQTAAATGFDAATIAVQTRRQEEVEVTAGQPFFFYSQPTELATAAAFQHTAVIANQPQNIPGLIEVGRLFGRIMYLLDSYQDLAVDHLAGRFNALAASFEAREIKHQATLIFRQAFAALQQQLQTLHLPKPQLIRKLLRQQLQHKAHKVLSGKNGVPDTKPVLPVATPNPGMPFVAASEIDEDPEFEGELDPDQEETNETEMDWQEVSTTGDSYSDWCYWGGGGWGPSCGEDDCDCDGDGDCDCGDIDCGDVDCGDIDCG